jgi:uncharacterized protein (TIGR03435 family)
MKRIPSLSVLIVMPLALTPALSQQPKFDLADVHASTTQRWFVGNFEPNNAGRIIDGRYILRDASLLTLIEAAYGVTEDMVAGGPSWLNLDVYDVIAKTPDGTHLAAAKLMLQSLLADRFALVARRATRPMPRFVLSVAKGGSKLKPAAASQSANEQDSGCRSQMPAMEGGRSGPINPASLPNMKVTCHNLTSAGIIENLRQMAGGPINTYLPREVFDSTGLEGKWDFELEFTPIGIVGDKGRDGITLYDAVSKQLGLTLELKDVPVPALVIESVNRNPTQNAPAVKTDLGLTTTRFEVASIKPINPAEPLKLGPLGGSELRFGGTLRNLITQAFMITPNSANDVIIGLPKSADSQVWLITAKLPGTGEGAPVAGGARPQPPLRSVVMEMLRGLLSDQFELKTHTESREVTVYAMTVQGKPKMTQADGTERSECPADPTAVKPFPNMGTMVSCRNMTMEDFAQNLNQATGFFDHPIVDATGLKGGWNFKIGWSRVNQGPPPPNANQAGEAAEPTGLTSYEAVERQMGVKLVKQRRSIPVIILDHVDEKPIE